MYLGLQAANAIHFIKKHSCMFFNKTNSIRCAQHNKTNELPANVTLTRRRWCRATAELITGIHCVQLPFRRRKNTHYIPPKK